MPNQLVQPAVPATVQPRVLLIEPCPAVREALHWYCVIVLNTTIAECVAGPDALRAVDEWRPTVVIIDPTPAGYADADALLRELSVRCPDLPIVVYTDPETAAHVRQFSSVAAVVVKGQHALGYLRDAVCAAHQPSAPAESPSCPAGSRSLGGGAGPQLAAMQEQGDAR